MDQTVLENIIYSAKGTRDIKRKFLKRVFEGKHTRSEDPKTHFCVYFAAFDPQHKLVFIGHHKKSGLWLFNGGHMEKGESPEESLHREIKEEWGEGMTIPYVDQPPLLTLTKIENPTKQICTWHYDIWYFIPLKKNSFSPDENLLAKEFYQIGWKTMAEAKGLVKDPNSLIGLAEIKNLFHLIR